MEAGRRNSAVMPQLRKEEVQVVKKGADRLRAEARRVIVSYDTLSGKMAGGARSNAHLRATAAARRGN